MDATGRNMIAELRAEAVVGRRIGESASAVVRDDRDDSPARAGVDAVVRFGDAVQRQGVADGDAKRSVSRGGAVGRGLVLGATGKSSLPSSRMVLSAKSIGQESKLGRGSRVASAPRLRS